MPRNPSAFRPVKYRTWGSGTTLVDEFPVPGSLYHGARGLRWCWRNRRPLVGPLLVVVLWALTGSLVVGLLTSLVVVALGLTGWLWWRRRRGEPAPGGLRETLSGQRQRTTLEKQWPLACKTAGILSPDGGKPPSLRRITTSGDGTLTARVESGRIGVPVPAIQKQVVTLSEVIGCREVVVTPTGPGVAKLAFHWRDPVGRHLPLADLPLAPKGRLAYGIRQDGSVASLKWNESVLIGGLTRSGKSNLIWVLLADCIRQRIPVDLYISDPKGGVELDAFEQLVGLTHRPSLIKVRMYASTEKETFEMLRTVNEALSVRQWQIKQQKLRKVEPSAENPLVVVILDEILPLTDMLKKGTDSPLGRVTYQGAHAGYVVWANTQTAQVDTVGRWRDVIPQRVCFATRNPQMTDSVLGQGADSAGARCDEIRQAGVGFSYAEEEHHPRKFRAAFVTDDDARLIAAGRLPAAVMHGVETMVGEQRGETALYRWYKADDPPGARPAYIGISYDVLKREAQHSEDLREFMEGDIRRTTEWWPTRKAALAAEKQAIIDEQPTYNIQHARRPVVRLSRKKEDAAA